MLRTKSAGSLDCVAVGVHIRACYFECKHVLHVSDVQYHCGRNWEVVNGSWMM